MDLSLKDAAEMAVNQKLILQNISWEFYEKVLENYKGSNAVHLAYDDGFLEVEVPLSKHEIPIGILSDLITIICLESDIDFVNVGSTTFRRQAREKGCEPDTAFYIQNEKSVRGLLEIDLSKDPPPDLVIEVDITSPSLNKMPIYAALGVSEIWRFKGEKITFHKLFGGVYKEVSNSLAFPSLTDEKVTDFLSKGLKMSSSEWFKEVREWVNQNA